MRKIIITAAGLALAAGLTGGLASSAQAAVQRCFVPNQCAGASSIKITGADISPKWPNAIFSVSGGAQFSKAGVRVTDFPVFIDGVKVTEPYGPWFGGGADTLYGSYGWNGNGNISPGKHVLTAEVTGVNGAVLATSARYTVTVPKPVQPRLACTVTTVNEGSGEVSGTSVYKASIAITSSTTIDIPQPWSLTFTVNPVVDVLQGGGAGYWAAQSGAAVTYTDPNAGDMLTSGYGTGPFGYQNTSPVAFTGLEIHTAGVILPC